MEAAFFASLFEGTLGGGFETMQVIERALAGDVVVLGIKENALVSAGVVDDIGTKFLAVGAAHNESASGVGAVV